MTVIVRVTRLSLSVRARVTEHRRAAAVAAVTALLPNGEAARELGHHSSPGSPLGSPLGLQLLRNASIPKRRRSGPVRAASASAPATPGSAPPLGQR